MSFDPFHEQQPLRDPAPLPAPAPSPAGDSPPGGSPPPALVRDRLIFPAILLIIVGILNLLLAGFFALNTLVELSQTPEQRKERAELQREMAVKLFPGMKKAFEDQEKAGVNLDDQAEKAIPFAIGTTVVSILGALLPLLAGIRMLQLRNYGLVFIGAIVSAIPCVSGSACCCLGEVAGIYAVIMLLQPDIRDAFR